MHTCTHGSTEQWKDHVYAQVNENTGKMDNPTYSVIAEKNTVETVKNNAYSV